MAQLAGTLLLVSWLGCWYLFFVYYRRASTVSARSHRGFALTTLAVAAMLVLWSVCMWFVPPQPVAWTVFVVGAAGVLLGQGLMVAARRALPLSNYDTVMRLSPAMIHAGAYRWMRHPMYAGLLLALGGSSLLLGNNTAFLALVPLLLALTVRASIESRA